MGVMKKFTRIFIITVISTLVFQTASAAPKKNDPSDSDKIMDPCSSIYIAEPPFLSISAPPSTSLLVDFSGSLNEHAYQEAEVKWETDVGNATAYTGFNATKEYYEYLDPYLYYK